MTIIEKRNFFSIMWLLFFSYNFIIHALILFLGLETKQSKFEQRNDDSF